MIDVRWRRARRADTEPLLALESLFPSDGLTRRNLRYLMKSASAEVWVGETEAQLAVEMILLYRRGSKTVRIYSIIVEPSRRGGGLGRAALALAERAARHRGCQNLTLEVGADNLRAQLLYSRAGFRITGQRERYYVDGTSALKMSKTLAATNNRAIRAA